MRILSTTVTLSIWIASAQAHYSFAHLSVNRSYLDEFWSYVYVREPAPYANSTNNTNIESPLWSKPGAPMYIPVLPEEETYRALMKAWPQTTQDILTVNHRCGRDAWNTSLRVMPTGGYKVFTRDVLAGDELSFLPERYSVGDQHYDYIGHVGPGMVYLAKKPDGVTLTEWDGDGDWFKIDYRGPKDNVTWSLFHEKSYTFTIPKTTPPGEYLLRVEHIYPSVAGESQFYVNCAQINISGPGGGKPTEFARFPGTYKVDDPAFNVPVGEEIVNGDDVKWVHGLSSYVPPGPPVWTG